MTIAVSHPAISDDAAPCGDPDNDCKNHGIDDAIATLHAVVRRLMTLLVEADMNVRHELKELLFQWEDPRACKRLTNRLDGAFLSGGTVVYGRSFDAMYAFLLIAKRKTIQIRQAAIDLFRWPSYADASQWRFQ